MEREKLQEFSQTNSTARDFFLWLKDQPYGINTLGVSIAQDFTGIDYYDLVSTFKELDKIGAGNFVVGRKGHDSRIIWKYDTAMIGKVAINGPEILDTLSWNGFAKVPDDAISLLDQQKVDKKTNAIKHAFNLRKDFQVELELPEDITVSELTRLKSWIDLLVY